MKSFREFIVEKPIVTPDSGVGYISNVPKKVAKDLINRAENKKSAKSKYFDATSDAARAGANTPGSGSSGRSGSQILKDLVGEPPKGRVSGSLSKGNLQFSGDAKYREMLAKIPSAEPKKPRTKPVKQAEVSKEIKKSLAAKSAPQGVQSPRERAKSIGTYNRAQERKYNLAKADIEARKGFSSVRKGGLTDRAIPGKAGEHAAKVWGGRSQKLGGNVWKSDPVKNTNFTRMFKSALRTSKRTTPRKTALPDMFGPQTGPQKGATKAYPEIPKSKQVPRAERPTKMPEPNAITHGVDNKGGYLTAAERKAAFKAGSAIEVYKEPKPQPKPEAPKPRRKESPLQTLKKEIQTDMKVSRTKRAAGAGGLLSALGAAQEYKVGAARAKREGSGKLGQMFRGASRATGAFLGGTGGAAVGSRIAGGIGAIGGGAYGYSKGAELGSSLAKKVEKSSAGKWLAKTAKKYLPGLG